MFIRQDNYTRTIAGENAIAIDHCGPLSDSVIVGQTTYQITSLLSSSYLSAS